MIRRSGRSSYRPYLSRAIVDSDRWRTLLGSVARPQVIGDGATMGLIELRRVDEYREDIPFESPVGCGIVVGPSRSAHEDQAAVFERTEVARQQGPVVGGGLEQADEFSIAVRLPEDQ